MRKPRQIRLPFPRDYALKHAVTLFPDMPPERALWLLTFNTKLGRVVRDWGDDSSETRAFIYNSMMRLEALEKRLGWRR